MNLQQNWFICMVLLNLIASTASTAAPLDSVEVDLPMEPDEASQEEADTLLGNLRDDANAQAPDETASSSEKALRAYRRGDFDQCLSHLRDAVARKPSLPPPDLVLANFHIDAARYAQARELLERYAATGSHHPQLFLVSAELAIAEGRLTDAWAHLELAADLGPPANWSDAEKMWFHGVVARGRTSIAELRSNWPEAVKSLEAWLEIEPASTPLRARYATALFAAGMESRSYEQFDIAHRRDAKLNPPEVALGVLSLREGKYDKADAWFEKAIAKYPDSGAVRQEYAIALLYQDRTEEAQQQGDEAAELSLNSASLSLCRGMIARQRNDLDAAAEFFHRVLTTDRQNAVARRHLALILADDDDAANRNRALTMSEALVTKDASQQNLAVHAWVLFRSGRRDEALDFLAKASQTAPAELETLFLLARLSAALGQTEQTEKLAGQLQTRIDEPAMFVMRPAARKWLELVGE